MTEIPVHYDLKSDTQIEHDIYFESKPAVAVAKFNTMASRNPDRTLNWAIWKLFETEERKIVFGTDLGVDSHAADKQNASFATAVSFQKTLISGIVESAYKTTSPRLARRALDVAHFFADQLGFQNEKKAVEKRIPEQESSIIQGYAKTARDEAGRAAENLFLYHSLFANEKAQAPHKSSAHTEQAEKLIKHAMAADATAANYYLDIAFSFSKYHELAGPKQKALSELDALQPITEIPQNEKFQEIELQLRSPKRTTSYTIN